jgi:hypothetical protein
MYALLIKEYQPDKAAKEISKKIELEYTQHPVVSSGTRKTATEEKEEREAEELIIKSSYDYQTKAKTEKPAEPAKKVEPEKPAVQAEAPEVPPVVVAPVTPIVVAPEPKPVVETPKAPEVEKIIAPEPVPSEPVVIQPEADQSVVALK